MSPACLQRSRAALPKPWGFIIWVVYITTNSFIGIPSLPLPAPAKAIICLVKANFPRACEELPTLLLCPAVGKPCSSLNHTTRGTANPILGVADPRTPDWGTHKFPLTCPNFKEVLFPQKNLGHEGVERKQGWKLWARLRKWEGLMGQAEEM